MGYDSNFKFGRRENVAAGDIVDVWPGPVGTITIATINEGIWAASSDVNDTGTLKIFKPLSVVGTLWMEQEQVTVSLNGTFGVFCGSFVAVERARTAFSNAGTITIQVGTTFTLGAPTATNNVRAHIIPERRQTEQALYTIPDSKDFPAYWIKHWAAGLQKSLGGNVVRQCDFDLMIWHNDELGWRVADSWPVVNTGNSGECIPFGVPFPDITGLEGKDRIKIQGNVTGGSTDLIAKFSLSTQLDFV